MSRRWQCPTCIEGELAEPRWSPGPLKELDAGSIVDLMDELDARLRDRSASASLYVVGGSAMLLAHERELATPDVDIARSVSAVDLAAREIAIERGLAMNWLNSAAGGWVPPRPGCAQHVTSQPGLLVHLAPPRHLLAMKLVAWRPKDEDDLIDLLEACGFSAGTAQQVADVLYEVYSEEDSLPGMLGVPRSDPVETRREAERRAQAALDLL